MKILIVFISIFFIQGCASNITHNLPDVDSVSAISNFADKKVNVRSFSIRPNGEFSSAATELHDQVENLKRLAIWKEVVSFPASNYAKKKFKDVTSYDEAMENIISKQISVDYNLDIISDRHVHHNLLGLLGILTLGIIPSEEIIEAKLTLRLKNSKNEVIKKIEINDVFKYWVSIYPLPYGHYYIGNYEKYFYRNLLNNALMELKKEIEQ